MRSRGEKGMNGRREKTALDFIQNKKLLGRRPAPIGTLEPRFYS
jgi:hypothetical protein